GRSVASPFEGAVDDHRLRHVGRAVAIVAGEVGLGIADAIPEHLVVPFDLAFDGARVRIEEELGRVEAVALRRLPRAVDAIAVAEPRPHSGQVDVPDLTCLFGHRNARLSSVLVEHAELHAARVLGEEREVDAGAIPGGAGRIGMAGLGTSRAHRRGSFSTADGRRLARNRRAIDRGNGWRWMSPSGAGRASDQFGHSLTVPGIFGRSWTARASSSVALTTTQPPSARRPLPP